MKEKQDQTLGRNCVFQKHFWLLLMFNHKYKHKSLKKLVFGCNLLHATKFGVRFMVQIFACWCLRCWQMPRFIVSEEVLRKRMFPAPETFKTQYDSSIACQKLFHKPRKCTSTIRNRYRVNGLHYKSQRKLECFRETLKICATIVKAPNIFLFLFSFPRQIFTTGDK